MSDEAWHERWRTQQIGFHQEATNPLLLTFYDRWRGAHAGAPVLVPLAGKTKDMSFLVERGHPVTGVELVEDACRAYFAERELVPVRSESQLGPIYRGGGVTLHASDFFKLSREQLGSSPLVYDRAALIALPEPLRKRYAEHLLGLLEPGSRMLLISIDYDPVEMKGPPFNVPPTEVRRLYESFGTLEVLREDDALSPRFVARGLHWMTETCWLFVHDPANARTT